MSERERVVRIPPERLGENIPEVVEELTHETFEGRIEGENSLIVLATGIEMIDEGRIVHGDGAVYQKVHYDCMVFEPELREVVEGTVVEVLKFGAFVRFGPLDGLLHISQIADDRIDIDEEHQRLICKESKRDLKVGDRVRARIVSVSINERNPRESKIGLTMRQPGLGKIEWLEEDRMPDSEKKEKAEKPKKAPRKRKGGKK